MKIKSQLSKKKKKHNFEFIKLSCFDWQDFWNYLLGRARDEWGLVLYEQVWYYILKKTNKNLISLLNIHIKYR